VPTGKDMQKTKSETRNQNTAKRKRNGAGRPAENNKNKCNRHPKTWAKRQLKKKRKKSDHKLRMGSEMTMAYGRPKERSGSRKDAGTIETKKEQRLQVASSEKLGPKKKRTTLIAHQGGDWPQNPQERKVRSEHHCNQGNHASVWGGHQQLIVGETV